MIIGLLEGDEAGTRGSKTGAFATIFALIVLTELWARAIPVWATLDRELSTVLPIGSVLALTALFAPTRRAGFAGLAAMFVWLLWYEFPSSGNHAYLELILCCLLAFLDLRDDPQRLALLRSVRWLLCVIFFYSGVQKIAHGYFFDGQYLAYALSEESWRTALGPFLPVEEARRLAQFTGEVGDGPYRVASPLVVAASNAVYVAEIALAAALLWHRTRAMAACAAVAFVILIEIAARELFFGLVTINSLLLFFRSDLNRRLVLPIAGLLALLILNRLGVGPAVVFY